MNWQWTAVMAIVGLAGGYLSWRSWRAWSKASQGCSGGCGCSKPTHPQTDSSEKPILISRDSLKLRSDR